jgi:hypothetical protein
MAHVGEILWAGGLVGRIDVVVEEMCIDGRQVPPRDLLAVQAVGFGVAGRLGRVVPLKPNRWKGSIPKHIHHTRIKQSLEPEELKILDQALAETPKRYRKEILDAVGLGCYHLGRITRAGTRTK